LGLSDIGLGGWFGMGGLGNNYCCGKCGGLGVVVGVYETVDLVYAAGV
jgi:hypothetical protein